ncbi:Phosphatidylserine decarboxylase [Mycena sanguinolenta]|uniref:Phosphatidylserine decarboxylase n=1 Tax=Mycena sanguinolenta TaxID=230812 RepID=A0A8H6Z1C2_9AGAR|nr:Phosphatidylserine decarboxylase [Mycena sanguinolenta]
MSHTQYNRPQHAPFSVKHHKAKLVHYGGWLPASSETYEAFFSQLTDKVSPRHAKALGHTPAVMEFADAIKAPSDYEPKMIDLFNQIFIQASSQNKIKDFEWLLHMLDIIVVQPPGFVIARGDDGNPIGEPIGVPIYIVFDLLGNTTAAYDLFRRPAFNVAMKNLLNSWGKYLEGPDSNKTLTDQEGGVVQQAGHGSINRGYRSWDEFFVREIQSSARPMHTSHDPAIDAGIIISACESTVLRIEHHVKLHDQFWLKGMKYSLYDMLAGHDTGGLRRRPISGTITKALVLPGTYYAVLPDDGAEEGDPDLEPGAPYGAMIRSQPWLTQSSTRALIFIKSPNPKIGMVCFIGVGMAEVSTCGLSVQAGQEVKKGDELGMFHFGGSTHALLFGPQTKITFNDLIVDPNTGKVHVNTHIKVLSALANVN